MVGCLYYGQNFKNLHIERERIFGVFLNDFGCKFCIQEFCQCTKYNKYPIHMLVDFFLWFGVLVMKFFNHSQGHDSDTSSQSLENVIARVAGKEDRIANIFGRQATSNH